MDSALIQRQHPSVFPTAFLAGLVGTVMLTALIYAAPGLGFPLIDYPRLIGGLFTSDPSVALAVGFTGFFVAGVLVFDLTLALLWATLPGDDLTLRGAAVKGLLFGLLLWVLSGLLLPVLGVLNRLGLDSPGLFALGEGPLGALELVLLHVIYGLAVALVAAIGRGIAPADTIGWMWTSHGSGESP